MQYSVSRQQERNKYDIYMICRKEEGISPKCKTRVTKAEFWYTVNALEAMLPGDEVSIRVLHALPMFHCPDHPDAETMLFHPEKKVKDPYIRY